MTRCHTCCSLRHKVNVVQLACRGAVLALVLLVSAGCAREVQTRAIDPAAWSAEPGVATEFTLTCGSDGSSSVSDDTVQAQPDGVHLRVVNEYVEPVSVGGFDADPGTTTWTLTEAPGRFGLSCWPYSQHTSGDEPPPIDIEIVDPSGLFVPGQVECPGEAMAGHSDFGPEPATYGPPPLDVARESIPGLRSDDIVQIAGYPEQDNASVSVIRDGKVIASYGFVRFEGRPWSIAGGTVCTGFGLKVLG